MIVRWAFFFLFAAVFTLGHTHTHGKQHKTNKTHLSVQSTLGTCPSLLGPYLRTFKTKMIEARPTYQLLQTYSLLSVVLREVPVPRLFTAGEDGGVSAGRGDKTGQSLCLSVMPTALNKKELTKGVLSGSPLLQAVTMNLMASILDRSRRVTRGAAAAAAAAGSSSSFPASSGISTEMASLLRQRMPEVHTLLGLRDKIGDGGSGSGSGGDKKGDPDRPAAAIAAGGKQTDRAVVLRWRLLSLLDRYAVAMPSTVAAARFDFLKLLPPPGLPPPQPSPSTVGQGGGGSSSSSSSSSADMHPLLLLATLRLLSREGVVAVTGATGGQHSSSSGWLMHRVTVNVTGTGSSGGSGSGNSGIVDAATTTTAATKHGAAENTPLGMVLRMALDKSLSPATRAAARALAVRALMSLGVVSAPPPHLTQVGADCEEVVGVEEGKDEVETAAAGVVEGETGVWLDVLGVNPEATGVLVMLATNACDNGNGLMAAGIRAAQKGMKENRFLRKGVGGGGGSSGGTGTGRDEDWEVEFRYVRAAPCAPAVCSSQQRT